LKLLEYKAMELFKKFAIPVKNSCVVDKLEDIEKNVADAGLSYPVVVKAQVQIGGRGKAGGIQFADNIEEVKTHCTRLLHSDLRGYRVNQLLITEKATGKAEWYLSIMLDRLCKKPLIIFSAEGGVEIEETSETSPDKIVKVEIDPEFGLQPYHVYRILNSAGLSREYFEQIHPLMQGLYQLFIGYDCLLCEINPLIVDDSGRLIALDGKVDIDDSALYRLPDILEFRDSLQEDELIKEARRFGFLYIPVEEGGSIAVASNGSGMLMSCIDLISKEGMKVGAALDLGGGATAERIKEAIRILFSSYVVKAVLINIFGGITRCDEVANGIRLVMETGIAEGKIVVLRMEGTNKEQGMEIISRIPGDIISTNGLRESVAALSERRARL